MTDTTKKVRWRQDAGRVHGYTVEDSSNVRFVGWRDGTMLVWFHNGGLYRYDGVSRQRAVACALAKSVGSYLNRKIKPNFPVTKLS